MFRVSGFNLAEFVGGACSHYYMKLSITFFLNLFGGFEGTSVKLNKKPISPLRQVHEPNELLKALS